jgi:hypothetical protein
MVLGYFIMSTFISGYVCGIFTHNCLELWKKIILKMIDLYYMNLAIKQENINNDELKKLTTPEITGFMFLDDCGNNVDCVDELKLKYDEEYNLIKMDVENLCNEFSMDDEDTIWVFYNYYSKEYSRMVKVKDLETLLNPRGITHCLDYDLPDRVKVIDITLNITSTDENFEIIDSKSWDVKEHFIGILGPAQNFHKNPPTLAQFIEMLNNNYEDLGLPPKNNNNWELVITKLTEQKVITDLNKPLEWN